MCVFVCVYAQSLSRVLLWNFPGKSTGVDYHFLLQGIFLTQWLNWGLLHHRRILDYLSHQGSPVSNGNVLKLTTAMVCTTLWISYSQRTVYTFQCVDLEVYKAYGMWIILLSVTQKILIELSVEKGEYNILKFFKIFWKKYLCSELCLCTWQTVSK